ncbi:hypothetical protein [Phreatobacter oligotrophus]|uniref:Portal protein n=1 Tax=Phreatobacter oligotrophus TaxID=1122261 RepID=A0A2T4ZIT6_9HYPH|nr:hypothetical protein [Phreatobacter oligotrophus]PTM61893.1 hypothetical protein C8P69_101565 [Phreatobacter oligotrophus]
MFDLQATDGSVRRKEYVSPIAPGGEAIKDPPASLLDGDAAIELHGRLLDHYLREIDRQAENRREMATDEDFYDNEQWSDDDKAILEARGQKALVYNVTATTIDWVLGTERRARSDFKVLPRRKKDAKPAERKSELLKYLSDCNDSPFHWSRAFADAVKVGCGWIEDAIQDGTENEPIVTRYCNWREMLGDSSASEMDYSDGRYIFRSKWVDVDVACAIFKNRKEIIESSVDNVDQFVELSLYGDGPMDQKEMDLDRVTTGRRSDNAIGGYHRRRVRLIECWYRAPAEVPKISKGMFAGEIYDPRSPGHQEEIAAGESEVVTRTTMRMNCAIFTTFGMLWMGPSPYRHNRFPFTPVWGFRRGRNGLPYGMIRRIRDIQEDINKRASKALHILSTNKVIMDEGAVDDIAAFEEEIARPDAVIVKKAGKNIDINADRDLSQWHLELMSRSIAMVQQSSGVTDELMGRGTNATSGIAIQSRQDQGQMATSGLFDNLRYAKQKSGEKQCSLLEQFMTERKAFRITDKRGNPQYIEVNDELPENDITRSKADFTITEADWRATIRQAQADELFSLLAKLAPGAPQLVMVVLDLLIESMDIPNREEIVKRIRQATGMSDPDQEEPTPDEMARKQLQMQQQQFTIQMALSELKKKEAEIRKLIAQAAEIEAKATNTKVQSQRVAMDAAGAAVAQPGITHVADHILGESGFKSVTDQKNEAQEAMAMAQAAQAQAAPQPQPPQGAVNV